LDGVARLLPLHRPPQHLVGVPHRNIVLHRPRVPAHRRFPALACRRTTRPLGINLGLLGSLPAR
jgi:hypothetical protein